jgi:hypothetical protein
MLQLSYEYILPPTLQPFNNYLYNSHVFLFENLFSQLVTIKSNGEGILGIRDHSWVGPNCDKISLIESYFKVIFC